MKTDNELIAEFMGTIWKYELEFNSVTRIKIPKGAQLLTVQVDQKTNKPCLWALVNTESEEEERIFELFGTGHEIKSHIGTSREYIGTYQYQKGEFIGHVFEYTGV